MNKEVLSQLSDELFHHMQSLQIVLLTTIKDKGLPFVNAISWTYARTPKTIRFAVDSKSQIVTNIKESSTVAMTIFFQESIYTINGNAVVISDEITGIPFKLTVVEVTINDIHDIMFYGSKISSLPKYEKTYNPAAAEKLDKQVLEALKA